MASDILKEIADTLYGEPINESTLRSYNNSYINIIAALYGVTTWADSTDIMADILTAVGGNPSTSTDYLQDIVKELGQDTTVNANWMEAWLLVATGPAFSDDRITEIGDSRFTEDSLYERITEIYA
jgi:hypothetical protein